MSTPNPYAAPTTPVADVTPDIPADIAKKIKGAWVAGCISGVMTLALTLFVMAGNAALGFSVWSLLDVVMIFGLAFGIYKKSRICAVVMLLYFVVSKVVLMMESPAASGLLVSLVFLYYYAQGVAGTFAFHRFKARQAAEAGRAG